MQDQPFAPALQDGNKQPQVDRHPARLPNTQLRMFGILFLGLIAPAAANERSGKPMEFDPTQSPEVVVVLPKSGIEETKSGAPFNLGFNANINYGRAFSRMGDGRPDSRDIDGYGVRWLGRDQLEVAKLKGTTTKTGNISYSVAARMEETRRATSSTCPFGTSDKRHHLILRAACIPSSLSSPTKPGRNCSSQSCISRWKSTASTDRTACAEILNASESRRAGTGSWQTVSVSGRTRGFIRYPQRSGACPFFTCWTCSHIGTVPRQGSWGKSWAPRRQTIRWT